MDTNTTPNQSVTVTAKPGAQTKRRFTPQFKARIVKLCEQPGAVLAQVARDHGLAVNLVGRWVREHRARGGAHSFVAVKVTQPAASIGEIRIECARGQQRIVVAWPASAARECAQWLREWLA